MKKKAPFQFLGAIILLLITLGIYAAAYANILVMRTKSAALAADIGRGDAGAVHLADAKAQTSGLAEDEAVVNQHLIAQSDVVSFLSALGKSATARGAQLTVVSVSSDTTSAHPHLTLSLHISGSFDAVFQTLAAIEYEPYDTVPASVSLDTSTGIDGARTWTASAVFSIGMQTPIAAPKTTHQ